MRLAIRHISRFRFDEHAPHVLQRLRLRPQSGPSQTVRAWQVTIDGVEPTLTYADGLGNRVDLVRHERDKPEFAIVAAASSRRRIAPAFSAISMRMRRPGSTSARPI